MRQSPQPTPARGPSIPSPTTHHCSQPQDLDAECLRRTELETKLKSLQSFVELMKTIYEQVSEMGPVSRQAQSWLVHG